MVALSSAGYTQLGRRRINGRGLSVVGREAGWLNAADSGPAVREWTSRALGTGVMDHTGVDASGQCIEPGRRDLVESCEAQHSESGASCVSGSSRLRGAAPLRSPMAGRGPFSVMDGDLGPYDVLEPRLRRAETGANASSAAHQRVDRRRRPTTSTTALGPDRRRHRAAQLISPPRRSTHQPSRRSAFPGRTTGS